METSKQLFEEEKRKKNSVDVIVRLTSATTKGYNFDVYTNDIKEKVKYIGTITKEHLGDSCVCQSFIFGNNENFVKENPLPFQCKHIMRAHEMMEGFWN